MEDGTSVNCHFHLNWDKGLIFSSEDFMAIVQRAQYNLQVDNKIKKPCFELKRFEIAASPVTLVES